VPLRFDVRSSDAPLVDCVWLCRSSDAGQVRSISSSHWHLVVGETDGRTEVTVHGPETRVTMAPVPRDATWVGIRFRLGTVLHGLPVGDLVDRNLALPSAADRRFWWNGTTWRVPSYDDAEDLVERLDREALIGSEPLVKDALGGTSRGLSLRTTQRRFHAATGLTRRAVQQIERARLAGVRLREGATPTEVAHELGYHDQPHLTRSVRRFLGMTPAELADRSRDDQLSLLFKTEAAESPVASVQDRFPADP
jgi:AraC-like DNA-binding protein